MGALRFTTESEETKGALPNIQLQMCVLRSTAGFLNSRGIGVRWRGYVSLVVRMLPFRRSLAFEYENLGGRSRREDAVSAR